MDQPLGYIADMCAKTHIFHHIVAEPLHRVLTILTMTATLFIAMIVANATWAQESADMDALFQRLAEPQGEGWRLAESDILREWSKSGSAAMDLLLQRGQQALDEGEAEAAIGHLTALTDHAPEFAEGFQTRAAAYATVGQYGPALADLAQTLRLEPRHFAALTQLGAMLEETGDHDRALAAYQASLKIHPHQQEAIDGVARLQRQQTGTEI